MATFVFNISSSINFQNCKSLIARKKFLANHSIIVYNDGYIMVKKVQIFTWGKVYFLTLELNLLIKFFYYVREIFFSELLSIIYLRFTWFKRYQRFFMGSVTVFDMLHYYNEDLISAYLFGIFIFILYAYLSRGTLI